MNPKKNILWQEMKNMVKKHYKMINFERVSDEKFVEDNVELTTIGEEIVDILKKNIDNKKIVFTDICGAPGNYSKLILKNFDANGLGISLPPEKGGVEFEINDKKYNILYKDILEKNHIKFSKENKIPQLDLGIASCVSYEIKNNNAYQLNLKLIITSLLIILDSLKNGGNLVINMTIKNINFAFNLVFILAKLFDKSSIWKSKKIWPDKNTFYFFGFGFKSYEKKYIKKLEEILLILKDDNFMKNIYFRKTLMNKNNFNIIDKMMNQIYTVKINHFKQFDK